MKEGEKQLANYMLSTVDNPFNPFTQFDSWYNYDLQKGYDCCGYLARIANTSDYFSDFENERETNRAIDEIVSLDPFGIYIKVSEETAKQSQTLAENANKSQNNL